MKIVVKQKCFAGTGQNMMPGQEYDLPEGTAQRLIAAGVVEEVKAKRGRKPVNRAIGVGFGSAELTVPEED